MNNQQVNQSNKSTNWSSKSDEWLAEAWREGKQRDKYEAEHIFQERYQEKLKRFVSKVLPDESSEFRYESAEDIVQEILVAFYNKISVEKIEKGVSNLLWTLARNKRADAVRRLTAERRIESKASIENLTYTEIQVAEESIDELIEAERLFEKEKEQIPYIDGILSGCERVIWVLRKRLGYPRPVVARLTDKAPQTVSSAMSSAAKGILNYIQSEYYELGLASQLTEKKYQTHVLERFAEPITPQFTSEELKPLGLTVEEFQKNYVASLILSVPDKEEQQIENNHLFLVLTRRQEWVSKLNQEEMVKLTKVWRRLIKRPEEKIREDYLDKLECNRWDMFPEEYLVKVERFGNQMILTPQCPVVFVPDHPYIYGPLWEEGLRAIRHSLKAVWFSQHSKNRSSILVAGVNTVLKLSDFATAEIPFDRTEQWILLQNWLQVESIDYPILRFHAY